MKHQANSFAISMPLSGPAETRNAKKLCVSDGSLVPFPYSGLRALLRTGTWRPLPSCRS